MQVFGLRRAVYRQARWSSRCEGARPPDAERLRREEIVGRWLKARADGLCAAKAARAVGASKASLYRWAKDARRKSRAPRARRKPAWTSALLAAVEALRLDYPMWGKAKLGPLLRAEGFVVADAAVGRILKALVERGVMAALRRRPQRPHATRLPKGLKADRPGALVQIDTLTIQIDAQTSLKQFTAYDPVARFTVAEARTRATATAAAQFLDKVIARLPFPVSGVQVDGGSEFMAAFEAACAEKNLALYVPPPKTPELNGGVERCNGAWRYEFYTVYDLPHRLEDLNPLLDAFADLYSTFRPHGALGGMTPAAYLSALQAAAPPPSQMA